MTNEKPHVIAAAVVFCMDWRLYQKDDPQAISLVQDVLGIVECDVLVAAGVSKALVEPQIPALRESLLWHIETSQKLHHINALVLVDHDNKCGAYGMGDPIKEEQAHRANLARAGVMLQEDSRFAYLKIILAIARIDEDNKVKKIEVVGELPPRRALV